MNVQALCVIVAGDPGDDVGGAEQGGVGDAGQGAAVAPVVQQSAAEDVLANALNRQALDFRGAGKACGLLMEFGQRQGGEAAG